MSAGYGLSKSRYRTGLSCHKALWLAVHERGAGRPGQRGSSAIRQFPGLKACGVRQFPRGGVK